MIALQCNKCIVVSLGHGMGFCKEMLLLGFEDMVSFSVHKAKYNVYEKYSFPHY